MTATPVSSSGVARSSVAVTFAVEPTLPTSSASIAVAGSAPPMRASGGGEDHGDAERDHRGCEDACREGRPALQAATPIPAISLPTSSRLAPRGSGPMRRPR